MTFSDFTDRWRVAFAKPKWLTAAMCLFAMMFADAGAAMAETRALKLYFVHTREKAEIVFKRNGRYDRAGLKRINQFLRDWRRNEPTNMDPRLFDVVWEAYKQSGSRAYIHVVSAYRSPATNNMLRGRSRGVAKKSQHMLGKAMDWYLPDVKLKTLRNIGLKMQAGGVGFYPRSGSPFVHFDVGRVRHWPGIGRSELASVFPSGKTLHVPSDGRPLPGYEQALAAYKVRQSKGDLAIASLTKGGGATKKSGGLLAMWFGGGADEEEDTGESEMPVAAPKAVVKAAPAKKKAVEEPQIAIRSPDEANPASRQAEITVLPPELAAPAPARAQQEAPVLEEPTVVEEATPETIIAALPTRNVPTPLFAPRPQADVGPAELAVVNPAEQTTEVAALIEEQSTALPVAEPAAPEGVLAQVPVPVWRPEYKAPTPAESETNALLALAAADPEATTLAPMPSSRPVAAAAAEVPEARPGTDGSFAADESVKVATKPARRPQQTEVASLQPTTTVTTTKSGRVKIPQAKPEPRPQVVAAAPAEWAVKKKSVTEEVKVAAKPIKPRALPKQSAETIVMTAPSEVYTAGFQRGADVKDPNRFTGKAVEFLSVAKFQ